MTRLKRRINLSLVCLGKRSYACNQCEYKDTKENNLKKHEDTIHGENNRATGTWCDEPATNSRYFICEGFI